MNNYELEKSIISAILQDFDKAQSTYLQAEWFTEPNFKTIFEILNNYGSRLDGLMELFAKVRAELKGNSIGYLRLKSV